MRKTLATLAFCIGAATAPAYAGPPYVTDDPEPTDTGHFEIYAFADGIATRDGRGGETGIDFNYGGAEDLQLTAVVPLAYETPRGQDTAAGLGNIELAVKYRFLHQDDFGWDVSVFPRVILPSASSNVGDQHAQFLLPFWAEKDFGSWSTFGGGQCALDHGDGAKNYCMAGWALTKTLFPDFTLGAEIYHQTADERGGKAITGLGLGAVYDLSTEYHLMASYGPGIQNAAQTDRCQWYVAVLTTF